MHGDRKIGLALGILLVGIVGAFFFRNESDKLADAPQMKDPEAIDDRIAERSVTPYLVRRRQMTRRPDETVRRRVSEFRPDYTEAEFLVEDPRQASQYDPPAPIPLNDRGIETTERLVSPLIPQAVEPVEAAVLPQSSRTGEYTIQPNDTLSHLAERFLGSSRRYKDLYELNRDRLQSPNDLRPGTVIRVPTVASAESPIVPRQALVDDSWREPTPTPRRIGYYPPQYPPVIERRIYIEREPREPTQVVEEPERKRRKLVLQSIGSGQ